jgi:hypothetical protein
LINLSPREYCHSSRHREFLLEGQRAVLLALYNSPKQTMEGATKTLYPLLFSRYEPPINITMDISISYRHIYIFLPPTLAFVLF